MTTNNNIQYLTDESGNKTAVLIPINEWKTINQKMFDFMKLLNFKKSIDTGFQEVADVKNGKIPRVSLKEFLDEL